MLARSAALPSCCIIMLAAERKERMRATAVQIKVTNGCVNAVLIHATFLATFIKHKWREEGNGRMQWNPPPFLLSTVCLASTTTDPFSPSLSITQTIGFGYLMHRVGEVPCLFGENFRITLTGPFYTAKIVPK